MQCPDWLRTSATHKYTIVYVMASVKTRYMRWAVCRGPYDGDGVATSDACLGQALCADFPTRGVTWGGGEWRRSHHERFFAISEHPTVTAKECRPVGFRKVMWVIHTSYIPYPIAIDPATSRCHERTIRMRGYTGPTTCKPGVAVSTVGQWGNCLDGLDYHRRTQRPLMTTCIATKSDEGITR